MRLTKAIREYVESEIYAKYQEASREIGKEYFDQKNQAKEMVEEVGLEFVPIVMAGVIFGEDATEEMVLKYADGYSLLNPKKRREGIVFRSEKEGLDLSFKAVSPEYLLKIGE